MVIWWIALITFFAGYLFGFAVSALCAASSRAEAMEEAYHAGFDAGNKSK